MGSSKDEVLFQRLGDVWYVFACGGDGVQYSALPRGTDPRSTGLEFYRVVEDGRGKSPPAGGKDRGLRAAS